ncbi:Ribokinase [Andreprevotia sp. IGB-42]|uniref:ribokinase n=1 Tax=Andreprevotia sp. IGB-42 TaxID=2497473 RepID=UPI00135983D0|nr:ribokinase [Andreprevotia sp. IGB-42]KAF0812148.1 Ribokinase [Andreprevotia sp. IGB-42]
MTRVLVVGSINMDLVVETQTFPRLGETLLGERFATYPGGKGANQAVAAARLGAAVTLIGCVGNDAFGAQLKAGLAAQGIDTRWIREAATAATGIAAITLCQADNAIVVVPGANQLLGPADLDAAEAAFASCDVVLAQLEVPLATVQHAAALASKHGKPFILNPAPASALPAALLDQITLLTPNEYELAVALGEPDAEWQTLLAALPGGVVMTKGAGGAYFSDADGTIQHQPGFKVTPVDTTGAGDTFNGALAAFWHLGLAEAAWRASAAGALSVTKAGAQGGMPRLTELDAFLRDGLQHAASTRS